MAINLRFMEKGGKITGCITTVIEIPWQYEAIKLSDTYFN